MKINIGKTPYLYPIPIVLAASIVNDKPNYTTVGDVAVMGLNPALMVISLNEKHLTTKGIIQNRVFSINIPTTQMLKKVDYCGIYSGEKADKASLFTTEKNEFDVPMIKECPVCIACKTIKDFNVEHRHIFVAEVMGTFADENYVESDNDKSRILPLNKLKPIIYGLDNKYYSIGEQIGTGYSEGREL